MTGDDPRTHDPVAELEARECRRLIDRALTRLPRRERIVVGLRFGLDGPLFTLREVGWLLRVTAERVRQIQARALRRLRHVVGPTAAEGLLPGPRKER